MLRYLSFGQDVFIPSYNLLIGIGIALAMLSLQYQTAFKEKTEAEKYSIHLSLVVAIILGFIGAFTFDAYSQHITLTFNNLNKIGLTFLGGVLSGLFVLIIGLKCSSLKVLKTLNILIIPFCIAHFFGRIGCFMAGCCFGTPTNTWFGVTFPKNSLPYYHYHTLIKIHPTQLYESAFVLCLVFFLIKFKIKHQFYTYLLSYSIFRFSIEFIRADNRGSVLNQNFFSPSQTISMITIFIVTILILNDKKIHKYKSYE